MAQQQAASHAQAQERDAEAKAEALQREQARLLASQATELRLGGELDRALAELRGWQAGGKDTEHGLLAEVGRWKAMVEEERSRHAAERARDGERAAVALEQERAAAAEQGEAQREQMRAMQAAMQSEMEWRASELERATKQGAVEREAHLAQLGIETRSAAEVREQASATLKSLNDARVALESEARGHHGTQTQLLELHQVRISMVWTQYSHSQHTAPEIVGKQQSSPFR